ncbi:MAG: aminoglycoside phosphotransferase [Rhodobacterales bacterium]|nr:MAG: aminoglycoside phosphotransferase [Rhodobacterales bacterium]
MQRQASTHSDPETAQLEAALFAWLGRRGLLSGTAAREILSGGRTNRLWHVRPEQGDRVVKLYREQDGNPLFPNSHDLEARALRHLPAGLAPVLCDQLDTPFGPCLIYAYSPGESWVSDPAPIARALGRVHAAPVLTDLPNASDGSAALREQTLAILDQCDGGQRNRVRNAMPTGEVAPSRVAALLHGDPVPGNIIHDGDRVTFIDWQCPLIGDPAHDLGMFLSPAMQWIYRGQVLSPAERQLFLQSYPDPETVRRSNALTPWHHWRMAAYCLWKMQRGAAEYGVGFQLEFAALESSARGAEGVTANDSEV